MRPIIRAFFILSFSFSALVTVVLTPLYLQNEPKTTEPFITESFQTASETTTETSEESNLHQFSSTEKISTSSLASLENTTADSRIDTTEQTLIRTTKSDQPTQDAQTENLVDFYSTINMQNLETDIPTTSKASTTMRLEENTTPIKYQTTAPTSYPTTNQLLTSTFGTKFLATTVSTISIIQNNPKTLHLSLFLYFKNIKPLVVRIFANIKGTSPSKKFLLSQ